MDSKWTHHYQSRRIMRDGDTLHVEAGLHQLGSQRPYFSVTGEVYNKRGRWQMGGCLHEQIGETFPELQPVIALHLSDETGEPMHAEANGWYWLAGYYGGAGEQYHGANGSPSRTPDQCLQVFANHVRVTLEKARTLADGWRVEGWKLTRRNFAVWAESQQERWKAEADAAIALLDTLNGQK